MNDWKAKVVIHSKLNKEESRRKKSTKQCTCGNRDLLLFSTLNLKSCTECYKDIPWFLEPDQKPLY